MYLTTTHTVGYLNFFHYYEQQQNAHPYVQMCIWEIISLG